MKTIQITIEDELLRELDKFLNGYPRGRSAFIRDSVAKRLQQEKFKTLEQQEEEGYRRFPITEEETISPENCGWEDEDFSDWEQK